jgi:hypothetical protein
MAEHPTRTYRLHLKVVAVCPINGVSVGNWDDRNTWSCDFKPEATDPQKAAAAAALTAFNIADADRMGEIDDELSKLDGITGARPQEDLLNKLDDDEVIDKDTLLNQRVKDALASKVTLRAERATLNP